MIKGLPQPTEAEEYRNTAEILRDLAAQARFSGTRNELFNYADNLDPLAARAEPPVRSYASNGSRHLTTTRLELRSTRPRQAPARFVPVKDLPSLQVA